MNPNRLLTGALVGATLLAASALSSPAQAEKIKIEKLDDLPRHTYQIDVQAVDVLNDHDRFVALAKEIEADLKSDLETYEITDKTTLKGYHQMLGLIALLEERYDDYQDHLREVIALEDKEAPRLMAGMLPMSWIDALQEPETPFEAAFEKHLRKRVNNLPYEVVEAAIKQQKGMMEIATPTLIQGMVASSMQPVLDESDGELTKDLAQGLVQNAFAIETILPHRELIAGVLAEYLEAHAVEKIDIWAARSVDLGERKGLTGVVMAVWDSGVDTPIFEQLDRVWTNEGEVPGNGKDDDENGFVDDVHGISFDLYANRVTEELYPVDDVEDRALLQSRMKGLRDVQMAIDSPEATELKQAMGDLSQDEVKPLIEGISAYGNHCHGTHVAGIMAEGNPAAELLAARLTFGHEMIPEKPTLEQAKKDAQMYLDTVAYFKAAGVRVVNMSWGAGIADIESGLAAHNDPEDLDERKALAREIFTIMKGSLQEAMASAPEILFCVAAGNSNNDNVFEEFIPSSIELPNVLTVGAVDEAGEETSFTTFGKVDVYANGFNVDSYVPGGDKMKLSGTSMASPNVANLIGKVLAVNPELTPSQVKEVIISTVEKREAGERTVKLIHPQMAVAEAGEEKAGAMR